MVIYVEWSLNLSEVDGYKINIQDVKKYKKPNINYKFNNKNVLYSDLLDNINLNQTYYTKLEVGSMNNTNKLYLLILERIKDNQNKIDIYIYSVKSSFETNVEIKINKYINIDNIYPDYFNRISNEINQLNGQNLNGLEIIKEKIKNKMHGYTEPCLKNVNKFYNFSEFRVDWLIKRKKELIKDFEVNKRMEFEDNNNNNIVFTCSDVALENFEL